MSFSSKQDQVADILRERIIAGAYDRGTQLKQADLAEELGVSITPVREALLMLEAEGYLRRLPHKGLIVPELISAQSREIYELRLMLERELTALALSRITRGKVEELKDLQRGVIRAIDSGDVQAMRMANVRFHFRLYEIAERPQSLQFVRILWAKYPFTVQEMKRDRPLRMSHEHDVFLERVEADDYSGAVDAMVQHIRNGWREVNSDNEQSGKKPPARKRALAGSRS